MMHHRFFPPLWIAAILGAASAPFALGAPAVKADLLITGAQIFTADPALPSAQALAVRRGRIVFIGSARAGARWVGPRTRTLDLGGARVLPGLIDSHIHPMDIVDLDVCDLNSKPVSLRELSAYVHQCLVHYGTKPGERLLVHQWNYTTGNEPDRDFPTLRVALDKAGPRVQIQLLGNDGHHGAFNSLALAAAKDAAGRVVGISKATLATDFRRYRKLVGVDARGEPNGAVNEDARYLINVNSMLNTDLDAVAKEPERITQRLNSVGITGIMDAMTSPESLPIFDALQKRGQLTVRATLALFFDPERFRMPDGRVDYDTMVARATEIRRKYASNPLIRADFVKLFADGVLEGNPYALPPTLPNGASLRNYLQPIFAMDRNGLATVTGYVDTAGPLCTQVRAHANAYADAGAARRFLAAHGFHPGQCAVSNGQLEHDHAVIMEFARRFHLAGFNLHIHVIGDRALRTALDAIEAARKADGNSRTHDSLAHIQLSDPADVQRIGRDRLYVAFTFAWMDVDIPYDLTVIPFLQHVRGNSYAALHPPGSPYDANAYPVKSVENAGGIITAGSDAPVETRDPRPFINMAYALTRSEPGGPVLNPSQRIGIRAAIDAYTINGARMLGIDHDTGSLALGKSADFIVLNQDILKLAADGRAADIAKTQVLQTWFRGVQVYAQRTAH